MKKAVIASLAGLGISFIGSIPLGYLNVIAYHIYSTDGFVPMAFFMLGIVIIECPLIYVIFKFTDKISAKPGFTKKLELFSILFLVAITLIALFKKDETAQGVMHSYSIADAFITGLLLNAINFVQLLFWGGWSIYVIHNNIVKKNHIQISLFSISAGIGTIAGMTLFVFLLAKASVFLSGYTNTLIAFVFMLLTLFQCFKFYKKYKPN